MSAELLGPRDTYKVTLEVVATSEAYAVGHYRAERGVPLWDTVGQSPPETERPPAYLVVVDGACSVTLSLGENGLTLRAVKLLSASHAVVTAAVTAGPGAPAWLPTESRYMLFDGDRARAAGAEERFIPFEGLAEGPSHSEGGQTPLDQLVVAVGRSVARANSALTRVRGEGGVALVSTVTIRLAVRQANLGQGRVMVTLASPEAAEPGQFVEFTMTTVPANDDEPMEEEQPLGQADTTIIRSGNGLTVRTNDSRQPVNRT